jgi:predicted transcriptional regulator
MKQKRRQGQLETEILGCLWDRPEGLTSQQILALLGDDNLAITTVLTVLSRLSGKGLVGREQASGRTFLFKSTSSREQNTASVILAALEKTENPASVFGHLVKGLSHAQIESLKKSLND